MEFLYILIGILIVILFFFRKKEYLLSKEISNILNLYFENIDFSNIKSIDELKSKLEIKNDKRFEISINHILEDAKHKINIFQEYREKHNILYNEVSFIKVTANCVINYSIKKNFTIKDSIKILLLILSSQELEELIGKEASKEKNLENFSLLLVNFIDKFEKIKTSKI